MYWTTVMTQTLNCQNVQHKGYFEMVFCGAMCRFVSV
jgi:hypothetical protein